MSVDRANVARVYECAKFDNDFVLEPFVMVLKFRLGSKLNNKT